MVVVLVLGLIVIGSVVFHLLSPWWWTPIASNWNYIDNTIIITFWITGIVFVAVISFMAYCIFRFRHRPGNRAAYEPENKRLEWWLAGSTARRQPPLSCSTSVLASAGRSTCAASASWRAE